MDKGALDQAKDVNFDEEVLESGMPVLVDFWAPWCGPCLMAAPMLEELAQEFNGRVKIVKMNVDENPKTPSFYGIRAIPTFILFKEGEVVDQVTGVVPKEQLRALLQKVASEDWTA